MTRFQGNALGLFPIEEISRSEGGYMTRYHLTPWAWWPFQKRLYLHHFTGPDSDAEPHDHPMDFRSFILWGGYTEEVWHIETEQEHDRQGCPACLYGPQCELWWQKKYVRRWPLTTHFAKASHTHRITTLHAKNVWTLFLRGPKTQDWGFFMGLPRPTAVKVVSWVYLGLPEPEEPAY